MAGRVIKNYENTVCKDCNITCIVRDQGLIITGCGNYSRQRIQES